MSKESRESAKDRTLTPCFSRSVLTLQVSAIRLALLFGCNIEEWSKWIQTPVIQSVLIHDSFSIHSFEEALAVRGLVAPHRFVDSYRGNRTPIPPLLLATIQPFITSYTSVYWRHVSIGVALLLVDYAIAWTMHQIAQMLISRKRSWEDKLEMSMSAKLFPSLSHIFETPILSRRQGGDSEPLFRSESLPFVVAHLFYASPITLVAGSILRCLQSIPVLFLLGAIYHAASGSGSRTWSALSLAAAAYLHISNIIFLIPIAQLYREHKRPMVPYCILCAVLLLSLYGLDFLLVGEQDYMSVFASTHLRTFCLARLKPSLSTLWYLGMELFDRFSAYFTLFLGGLPYILIVPTTIRLYRYPEALVSE